MKRKTEPPKETIPVPQTAREIFAILRAFFAGSSGWYDAQRKAVWDVLTALRGPDNDPTNRLKRATTSVIRERLFGSGLVPAMDDPDTARNVPIRKQMDSDHFARHARNAFEALDLKWDRNNNKRKKKK